MDKNKIRRYPPIFVTMMVAVVFTAVAIHTTAGGAPAAQADDLQGGGYTVSAEFVSNLETVAPTQHEAVEPEPTMTEPEAEATYESTVGSRDWDAEDAERLMRIAMAEAEGESTAGKALVMLVVLNRVWSDEFPDTIEEVIFQPGQFSVTTPGGRYYTTEPDEGCREALYLVSTGWDESQGALYFESCKNESWQSRNLEYLFQEGNHKFYK